MNTYRKGTNHVGLSYARQAGSIKAFLFIRKAWEGIGGDRSDGSGCHVENGLEKRIKLGQ